jgi:hypothetical protein
VSAGVWSPKKVPEPPEGSEAIILVSPEWPLAKLAAYPFGPILFVEDFWSKNIINMVFWCFPVND